VVVELAGAYAHKAGSLVRDRCSVKLGRHPCPESIIRLSAHVRGRAAQP
jgi:hypothetical protein